MKKYSFTVSENPDSFSLSRVVMEAKTPDNTGFIVHLNSTHSFILCLYNSFLNKFSTGDNQIVSGEALDKTWGHNIKCNTVKINSYFNFECVGGVISDNTDLPDARFKVIQNGLKDKTLADLAVAKSYKRLLKIHVSIIE